MNLSPDYGMKSLSHRERLPSIEKKNEHLHDHLNIQADSNFNTLTFINPDFISKPSHPTFN